MFCFEIAAHIHQRHPECALACYKKVGAGTHPVVGLGYAVGERTRESQRETGARKAAHAFAKRFLGEIHRAGTPRTTTYNVLVMAYLRAYYCVSGHDDKHICTHVTTEQVKNMRERYGHKSDLVWQYFSIVMQHIGTPECALRYCDTVVQNEQPNGRKWANVYAMAVVLCGYPDKDAYKYANAYMCYTKAGMAPRSALVRAAFAPLAPEDRLNELATECEVERIRRCEQPNFRQSFAFVYARDILGKNADDSEHFSHEYAVQREIGCNLPVALKRAASVLAHK